MLACTRTGCSGVARLGSQALCVAFHPSASMHLLAAGTVSGEVAIMDARKLAQNIHRSRLHRAAVFDVIFVLQGDAEVDDDGGDCTQKHGWVVATASADASARLTRLSPSSVGDSLSYAPPPPADALFSGHTDYVRKVRPSVRPSIRPFVHPRHHGQPHTAMLWCNVAPFHVDRSVCCCYAWWCVIGVLVFARCISAVVDRGCLRQVVAVPSSVSLRGGNFLTCSWDRTLRLWL